MCYIQLRTSALERFLKACPSQGRVFSNRGTAVRRKDGPVAQLGARFHGMEEVDGSNPSRSTKPFKHLPSLTSQTRGHRSPTGVRNRLVRGQSWAGVGSRYPPIMKPYGSTGWHAWALGH